jgi:hypothetical protein
MQDLLNAPRLSVAQRWLSWTGNGTYFLKTSAKHATLLLQRPETAPRLGYSLKKIRSHSFNHLTGFEDTRCTQVVSAYNFSKAI